MLLLLLLPLLCVQGERPQGLSGASPPLSRGCDDRKTTYELQVPNMVTVQEGLCVLVNCRLSYPTLWSRSPSSDSVSWFRKDADTDGDSPVATSNSNGRWVQRETQGRFLLLGNLPQNCSLFIRDARRADSGSYFLRVEAGPHKWNYCRNQVSVRVTALTHTPHILIPPTLEPGRPSNLTCSVPWACEWGTPPVFSWMSATLTSLGPRTRSSSELTLIAWPQDHGTNLTCQVTFPGAGVTVETTVQLNVSRAPRTGKPAEALLGALAGAGVTALLSICVCLVFFLVKTHRKKAARMAGAGNDPRPAEGPVSQGHQQKSTLHSPADPSSILGAAPTFGEEQELHYASLSFHRASPREDNSTHNSEIRTQ